MTKENNLTSVKDAVVNGINKSRRLKEGVLKAEWTKIVGKFAAKSQPEFIKDGVLNLIVEGPIFAQHFNMKKNQIIETINNYFNAEVVKDLVIRTGQLNENRYEYLDTEDKSGARNAVPRKDEEQEAESKKKKPVKAETGLKNEDKKSKEDSQEISFEEGHRLVENEDMSEAGILKKIDYLRRLAIDREKYLLSHGYKKCKCCGMIFESEDGEEFCKVCIEEKKDREYRRRGME